MRLFLFLFFLSLFVNITLNFDTFIPNGNNYRRRVALRFKFAEQAINEFASSNTVHQNNLTHLHPLISRKLTHPSVHSRFKMFKKVNFLTSNIAHYVSTDLYFRLTTALFSNCRLYVNEEHNLVDDSKLVYFRVAFIKDVEKKKYVYLHTIHYYDIKYLRRDTLLFIRCSIGNQHIRYPTKCTPTVEINETLWEQFKRWHKSTAVNQFIQSYENIIDKVKRRLTFFRQYVDVDYQPFSKCNSLHIPQRDVVPSSTVHPEIYKYGSLDDNCPSPDSGPFRNMLSNFTKINQLRLDENEKEIIFNVTTENDCPKYAHVICFLNATDLKLLFHLWFVQKYIDVSFKDHLEHLIIGATRTTSPVLREIFFRVDHNELKYARLSIMFDGGNKKYHVASTFNCLYSNVRLEDSQKVAPCLSMESNCNQDKVSLRVHEDLVKNFLRSKSLDEFSHIQQTIRAN